MIYKMELADSVDTMVFDLLEVPIVDNDITGIASNTTIDGNVFNDYLWLKKQYVQKWSILCQDEYEQLRGFWTRQFGNAEVPFYRLFYGKNDYEERNALTVDGYIQIENPTERLAPLSLTHLYGNATQETLSGKNLLHVVDQGTYTTNGITSSSSNQTIKLTGTNTASANFGAWSSPSSGYPSLQPNTTYTISAETNWTSTGIYIQLNYLKTGGGASAALVTLTPNAQAKVTFTVPSDFESVNSFFVGVRPTVTTINNAEFRVQIEAGSTATAYEPYTGGSPMPNPQFPSPVETVTGGQTVKITGKNLVDINGTVNLNRVSKTISGQSITLVSSADAYPARADIPFAYDANRQMTISFDATCLTYEPTESNNPLVYLRTVNGQADIIGSTALSKVVGTTVHYVATVTPDNNTRSLWLYVKPSAVAGAVSYRFDNIQVEYGASETSYEPYQEQSQEINLGKNLFHFPLSIATSLYGVAITASANASTFVLNGTSTATSAEVSQAMIGTSNPLKLKAGTYTCKITGLEQYTVQAERVYLAPTSAVGTPFVILRPDNGWTRTFTLTEDTDAVMYLILSNQSSHSNTEVKVQIEAGTQATSYSAYKTPIELVKIGTYQDRIYKDNGTWKIHKEVGKVVLDGSESGWGIFSNNNAFYSRAYDVQIPSSMTTVGAIMANYYTADSESNIYNARVDYGIGISSQNRFLIRNKDITTVASFKTWLGTHPTTVYYALATPTDTEITDSELIGQLNHVYELYQGTNNLWLIPSAGAQGEMEAKYRLIYDEETDIIPQTPVVLTLSDGGVINPCGCRQNVQLTMRETKESSES